MTGLMSPSWLRAGGGGVRECALGPLNAQSFGSWHELKVLEQFYVECVNKSLSGGLKDSWIPQQSKETHLQCCLHHLFHLKYSRKKSY